MNQTIPNTNSDTITNVVADNWQKTACSNIPPYFETLAVDGEGSFIGDDAETETNEAWVNGFTTEMYDAQVSPVFYASGNEIKFRQCMAKCVRNEGRYAPITVDGLTFDADAAAYENIKGSIYTWDSLLADQQLIDKGVIQGDTMLWTLADNSLVYVTREQLVKVSSALSVRAALLHVEYTESKQC